MTEKQREFKEVAGKVVEKVVFVDSAEGELIEMRFEDKTGLQIHLGTKLVIESVELRDWVQGEGTLVKKLI